MISEETVQQVKKLGLISIVGNYTSLKRKGSQYEGLCPFHNERTSSFIVHDMKGYKCFGCGIGGKTNVDFIMEAEHLSFVDAVKYIAQLNNIIIDEPMEYKSTFKREPAIEPSTDCIPALAIENFIIAYRNNHLFTFLVGLLGEAVAKSVCHLYQVGSNDKYGPNTTVFIQRDINGRIRQVKTMLYNPETGRRIKDKNCSSYIGKQLLFDTGREYDNINLVQCFFGEHLLQGNKKQVAICESEKTALIASNYYPQFVWLATGGKNGCRWYYSEVCKVLQGRKIFLFPDADALNDWKVKAEMVKAYTDCQVKTIDIMNGKPAPDGMEKYDIADLLLNRKPTATQQTQEMNGVSILIDCIINKPFEVISPSEFDNLRMLTVRTPNGDYDILLDSDGKPLSAMTDKAKALEQYFNKQFQQARIEGVECLAHILTKSTIS